MTQQGKKKAVLTGRSTVPTSRKVQARGLGGAAVDKSAGTGREGRFVGQEIS